MLQYMFMHICVCSGGNLRFSILSSLLFHFEIYRMQIRVAIYMSLVFFPMLIMVAIFWEHCAQFYTLYGGWWTSILMRRFCFNLCSKVVCNLVELGVSSKNIKCILLFVLRQIHLIHTFSVSYQYLSLFDAIPINTY